MPPTWRRKTKTPTDLPIFFAWHAAETAAGLAGLVKVLLCFAHEQLPGLVHFQEPNRHVAFTETPLVPLDRPVPWPRSGRPRLAGVSAFGFGGTNAHVVLAEPPAAPVSLPTPSSPVIDPVLVLSGRDAAALATLAYPSTSRRPAARRRTRETTVRHSFEQQTASRRCRGLIGPPQPRQRRSGFGAVTTPLPGSRGRRRT